MKHIAVFFVLLPLFASGQASNATAVDINWHLDYDTALAEARKADKNLLVYFTGSDWCSPCKMLKKDLFETTEFRAATDDYVMLYVDIPKNKSLLSAEQLAHNMALLPRFNKRTVFPIFIVVDHNEIALDQLSGYNMRGEIGPHMEFIRKYRR